MSMAGSLAKKFAETRCSRSCVLWQQLSSFDEGGARLGARSAVKFLSAQKQGEQDQTRRQNQKDRMNRSHRRPHALATAGEMFSVADQP